MAFYSNNIQVPYLYRNGNQVVPVSPLDNFLILNDLENYELEFYNVLDGTPLNSKKKITSFYSSLTELANSEKYLTTDHLIYSFKIDGLTYCYVSLDNSVRSNMNGLSLAHNRLDNLMRVLAKILESNPSTVVFFSESCRPSFIGNITQRKNEVSWLAMREKITTITSLEFLVEKRNNEDYSGLSFGISVWVTQLAKPFVSNYYSKELLDVGFGSVAIGIKSTSNKIVWGVHFPLDFKNSGEENHGVITMKNLIKTMVEYPGSICAFGDMNTIPGQIDKSIREAVLSSNQYRLILRSVNTFFGAFYDTIPIGQLGLGLGEPERINVIPTQLLDMDKNSQYKILEYVKSSSDKLEIESIIIEPKENYEKILSMDFISDEL